MQTSSKLGLLALLCFLLALPQGLRAQREMERLGRGVVAIAEASDRVFVSWRMLGTEPDSIAFNVYRSEGSGEPRKLNAAPLTDVTFFRDTKADLSKGLSYFVKPVEAGVEGPASASFRIPAGAQPKPYLSLPLRTPEGYSANDASVGDLDGDGEYEIVIHMTGRSHDNSQSGPTDPPILQAYRLDGSFLWEINLGKNIREGAHYTQFLVYDFDGDGRAEVVCKTADGTRDGVGKIIGDPKADYVLKENTKEGFRAGYIVSGPEFLTVFDGRTGAALATTNYVPPRHPTKLNPTYQELKDVWGDGHGNRMDRYLAGVAYLDGVRPSIVMCRGYYTRSTLAAWDWRGGKLTLRWLFDSDDGTPGNRAYRGQGDHQLAVADLDGDGKDEIVYGSCVIDDNGKGLYSTGRKHGDALHLSDLDPDRPGLEVFQVHEEPSDSSGGDFRDARTGEMLWKLPSDKDAGRGMAAHLDPRYKGDQCWSSPSDGLYSCKGVRITEKKPRSCNFAVWWDGSLQRQLLDKNRISRWNWQDGTETVLVEAEGCSANNGTKATPTLSADLFGDWREEVVWRTNDSRELRIYVSTFPTKYRFRTLMHDPVYRLSIAWQNVAYNQPPHLGFYLGEGMKPAPKPDIVTLAPKTP